MLFSYCGVYILPNDILSRSRREALPVCNPTPAVTLQTVLCIAAATREPSQMQQQAEAPGENQDRGETWASLAIQNLLAVLAKRTTISRYPEVGHGT